MRSIVATDTEDGPALLNEPEGGTGHGERKRIRNRARAVVAPLASFPHAPLPSFAMHAPSAENWALAGYVWVLMLFSLGGMARDWKRVNVIVQPLGMANLGTIGLVFLSDNRVAVISSAQGMLFRLLLVALARGIGFIRLLPDFADWLAAAAVLALDLIVLLVSLLEPKASHASLYLAKRIVLVLFLGVNAFNVLRTLKRTPNARKRFHCFALLCALAAFFLSLGLLLTHGNFELAFAVGLNVFVFVVFWPRSASSSLVLRPEVEEPVEYAPVEMTEL